MPSRWLSKPGVMTWVCLSLAIAAAPARAQTADDMARLATLLRDVHLIQDTCHALGPEALFLTALLERTYAGPLSGIPVTQEQRQADENWAQIKKASMFDGKCVLVPAEQQFLLQSYVALEGIERSYYLDRVNASRAASPQAGAGPLTAAVAESNQHQPALAREGSTVLETIRATAEAARREAPARDALAQTGGAVAAASDLMVFYHEGGALRRGLDGGLIQSAPAKVCLNVQSGRGIYEALRLLRGETAYADPAKPDPQIERWVKFITVTSRIFDARHIAAADWIDDPSASVTHWDAGCDILLMWDNANLHYADRFVPDAARIWAGTPRLDPITAADFNAGWDRLNNEAAQTREQHQALMARARSGQLEGLGFLRVSGAQGLCVETGTDYNVMRALIALKNDQFGGAKPTGSFENGSLEDMFAELKHGSCGYFAGAGVAMRKILAGLDRDLGPTDRPLIWVTEAELAPLRDKVIADEKAAEEKQRRDQQAADEAARAAREQEAKCEADATCRADRERTKAAAERQAAEQKVAVLTCRIARSPLPVSACLGAQGHSGIGGAFKIRNGESTRSYSGVELYQEFASSVVRINLDRTFSIVAQANSDENMVLRLEIKDGTGKSLFADEASAFGVIRTSD